MPSILMSIHPRHVANILSGEKTIEIRRRRVAFPAGTKIWIYSTLPVGAIKASVDVLSVNVETPSVIWKKYHNKICINKCEYDAYTQGTDIISAIKLSNVDYLENGISLNQLKNKLMQFSPPQSYYYIHDGSDISNMLHDICYSNKFKIKAIAA